MIYNLTYMKKMKFIAACVLLLAMCSCKDSVFEKYMGDTSTNNVFPQDTTVVVPEWKKKTLEFGGHTVIIYEYKYDGHWQKAEKWDNDIIRPTGHSHNCDCLVFD